MQLQKGFFKGALVSELLKNSGRFHTADKNSPHWSLVLDQQPETCSDPDKDLGTVKPAASQLDY